MNEALKQNKAYKVPTKSITWNIDRHKHTLNLTVKIYWNLYQVSENKLPPTELGITKEWKFQVNEENDIATFIASWDIRRVKEKLENIAIINDNIFTYAVDE